MSAPIYHPGIVQNTEAWDDIRRGKWTASNGAKIMGGLETQGLKDLVKDLAWGRAIGRPDRGYNGKSMERGHELEPEARNSFAFDFDAVIEQVGFVEHGRIPYFGWSPDGLHAKRRRGLEIKCLEHKAWIDFFQRPQVPSEYVWQTKIACMVGQLDALDFYVYHPLAGGMAITVEITDTDKDQIEGRIALLEPRVQALVDRLLERKAA
jgi:putative phage-type endonuclease